MSNINRDYLIVLNPKTSKVTVPELNYYIYDKYTANLFVNLVTVENGKVVNMVDADQYKLVLHVLKPTNEIQTVEDIQVFNKEKALFQIELDQTLTKNIGRYKCELLTIDKTDHIVQSAKFSYRVKKSIYNDLDVVTETPQYPIIITLLDKLQDIDKYEEERRANEVARVAAEKARVKDYTDLRKTVTTDIDTMQQKIDSFDGKVQEVDNAVTQMRTNIDNYQKRKNEELDNYTTQKDTQINTAIKGMETTIDKYKTEKDTQINDKITQQDNKIDSAINLQNKNIQASTKALNDKLDAAVQDQNNTIAANNQAQNKVISDAVAAQNKTINTVVESDKVQNDRLDILESNSDSFMYDIDELQDKDVAHEERMTAIEAVDVEQNNRLDAIEIKNDQQDGRLNDVEAKNKKQDLDLKCLFAESHSERITLDNEVGNSVFLQNSKQGFATVDELKGNTLVNCNKDTDKELILNGNIDTSGYGTVTTTEGVDGGKVDIALEGNTMVNVCDQEEPVAITKNYEVTTGNHVALQGEYDGKCRPNIYGNTLVNLIDNFNGVKSIQDPYTANNKGFTLTKEHTGGITYFIYKLKYPLNKGKKYTIIYDIVENTLVNTQKDFGVYVDAVYGAFETNTTTQGSADGKLGRIISAQTTKSTDENLDCLSIGIHQGDAGGKLVIDNLMLLEGDYTNKPIPEYFTGMQSSFEDKLITDEKDAHNGKYKVDYKVTGKNKWNGAGNTIDKYTLGLFQESYQGRYIKVGKPNTNYVLSFKDVVIPSGHWVVINAINPTTGALLEAMNICKTGQSSNNNVRNIVVSSDSNGFVRLSIYTYGYTEEHWKVVQNLKFQIEEGDTATTYEPYKEYTKTLYLNTPLLEGDTIEQSGNDIVHMHRYNTVTFDGSSDEKWTYWADNIELDSSLISFYLPFTDYKDMTAISDRFLTGGTVWQGNTEKIALNGNGSKSFQVALLKSRLATQDLAGFKKYLQQNPITVVYELATPTKEVISTNDNLLLDSYVNGHLDVDSVVPIDKVAFQQVIIGGLKYLYPNTEYTIQFESDNIGKLHYHMNGGYGDINVVKGINKFNLTTKDKINWLSLDFNGIGFNASKIVVTPKVEQPFGYFKGMKSVGECEDLEIVSNNNDNTLSNKQTITHEPLRGLPNGTKDKYVIIDGKWYIERNCMVVQFKDLKYTKINDYQKAEFPDVIGFRLMNTGLISPIMCDRFAYSYDRIINFGQLLTNKENINICNNGNMDEFFITIQKAKLKTLNFNGLMNYFTENPMEIIAKATTPTYEPIDYNPFEVYAATTHISNNSNIPCNMVIRNSGFNCILKPNTTYTVSSNNGLSSVTTKASIGDGILRFYDKDTTSITKMSNVLVLEGDYITGNPPIPAFFKGMESAFEQELVTDEKDKNYGKYKVNVKATNPDNNQQNNITFYLKEPLRGIGNIKDKVYVKEDKVAVERNCGIRAYEDGDFATYLTDKVNTVYPLATPTYEEVEYFDLKLFVEIFKDTTIIYNSNIPVTSTINYTYATPLTDAVNTVSDISDQQDSMIIDMATQVATMQMMLM